MKIAWSDFKNITDSRGMDIILIDLQQTYYLYASEQNINLECQIIKETEEAISFEASHLSKCNKKRNDNENTSLVRLKYCTVGWNFLSKTFEIETSKIDSLYTENYSGPCTSVTAKFLNAANTEITTQEDADLYCVISEISFFPTWSYELLGGRVRQQNVPDQPVRVFVRAVPDFSSAQGGSKDFVTNLNLQFIEARSEVMTDGRASKTLTYTAGLATNKISFHLKHPAGFKHKVQFSLELFKQ